jgi:ABC-2 type transport system permease protein
LDEKAASDMIDRGQIKAMFCINKGFEANLRAGKTADIQVIADGTDSNTASIVMDYARKIASQFSKDILTVRLTRLSGSKRIPGGVELQARAWFNENLESRNFFVPGVMAIVAMLVTLMLTSMAVVREKEIGTMEQIIVTPIKPAEFILGKTIPFALIGFTDVILITVVGVLWFAVPIRGNILLLLGATVLYLLSALGIGLLISTVSKTQQQAMMTTFFFFFPAVLLSGFMFPIRNMPAVIQWLTYFNPLRYFLVIIRGIFLKGLGANMLWQHGIALLVIGGTTLWLSAKRFKKTLS